MEAKNNDPFYLEIATELREKLLSGKFRPGQRFYSIRGLIKETGRSLPTVRSALGLLIRDGLLEARQGSGYYVTSKVDIGANQSKGFNNFLAVMPSSSVPDEPWFTGRISTGMIEAANEDGAIVSFYRRQVLLDGSSETARVDLDRIAAMRPDGVVWLHSAPRDIPILKQLQDRGLPIVTTMRRLPEMDLPLLREDDVVYASVVLSNFEARGHRRIGVIGRSLKDDYFKSKMEALREVAASSQLGLAEADYFEMREDDPYGEGDDEEIEAFLEERPSLTGLLVLASTGIRPLIRLFNTPLRDRLCGLSLVLNILDGVPIPSLPTGETMATISPPLEKLGEQLVHYLSWHLKRRPNLTGAFAGTRDCSAAGEGEVGNATAEAAKPLPRLIPIFQPGDSLRSL